MFVNKRITEFGTHAHASHGSLIPEYDCIESVSDSDSDSKPRLGICDCDCVCVNVSVDVGTVTRMDNALCSILYIFI